MILANSSGFHRAFSAVARAIQKRLLLLFRLFQGPGSGRASTGPKILILAAGFLVLALLRLLSLRFNFHLGYLYLMLVCLGGFWFGIRGGIVTAIVSSGIFLAEVSILRQFAEREAVLRSMFLRFAGFAWGGIMTGLLAEILSSERPEPEAETPDVFGRNRFLALVNARGVRIGFLAASYALVILLRVFVPALAYFLDYLSVILVCVTGFWFGIRGGLIGATVTFSLFLVEAFLNPASDPSRHFFQNQVFSFFFCYGIGIVLGFVSEMEKAQKDRLRDMAYYDELTGCVNFRSAMQILEREISRAARFRNGLTIMILDIDNFKQFNDRYGHQAGNRVLKDFSSVVRDHIRKEDALSRFGGDEFLVILPQTQAQDTVPILNKIRAALENRRTGMLPLHFSAGISYFPMHGHTPDMLFNAADNALYEAKKSGKNAHHVERRQHVRYVPDRPLRFVFQDPRTRRVLPEVTVKNISCTGMLVNYPAGSPLQGELICRDGRLDENGLLCTVVYRKTVGIICEAGITFPKMPDQTLRRIVSGDLTLPPFHGRDA